jgi:pimeloyl-ACP methyl ester carboxylesterase
VAGVLPHRLRRFRRAMAGRLAIASSRGLALLPCATPLSLRSYSGGRAKERLIIFLPGLGDVVEDFETNGFLHAIAEGHLPADAIAVDAHYGYYARRSVIDRLAHDVVLPARKRGYRDIWLVGISMGGMGALSYAMHHPEHVARVVLLGAYLGDARVIREIAEARGRTQPTAGSLAEHTHRLWSWIKRYAPEEAVFPKLYLGYGTNDRFGKANALLAGRLPAQHVLAIPGGHDWRTWRQLWNAFVASWIREADHGPGARLFAV